MKSFSHKVAAITGAGSGIGRSLAVGLVRRGCHVAISDVNAEGLDETARLAREHGVKVTTARVDVADRDQVHAWADEVVRDHGKCNLVFNNAGVTLGTSVEGFDYEEAKWIVDINFWGVVYGTKAFLPHLRASGEGHVVNISSLFGLMGFPGQSTYNATKFAVRGFTEALRIELEMMGAPVSATCVHPGGIKTNIARAARMNASVRDLGMQDMGHGSAKLDKMFTMSADDAADIILRGVQKNARRVLVGRDAKVYDLLQRLVPGSYHWIVARGVKMMLSALVVFVVAGCTSAVQGDGSTSASSSGSSGASGSGSSSGSSGSSGGAGTTPPNAVTFGPDLSLAPTNTMRCVDGHPVQINPTFPQPFVNQGAQSCTLLTFIANPNPATGSGIAVAATIKVGPTTGRMRFVRMRILFRHGVGPKCCSLEEYGQEFTPTANAQTRVPLNFAMKEDHIPPAGDLDTIAENDLVALEVLEPNVPIPGTWPKNGAQDATIANYLWLPSLSASQTPAPSNMLLNYTAGFGGLLPLFTFEFVQTN